MENVQTSGVLSPVLSSSASGPRSRRMGGFIQPPVFPPPLPMDSKPDTPPHSPKDELLPNLSPSSTSSFPPPPPPPPRSPLRGMPKSVSSFATLMDLYTKRDTVVTVKPKRDEEEESTVRDPDSLIALLAQFELNTPMPPTPSTELSFSDSFTLIDEKPLPIPPVDDSPPHSPTATIIQGVDKSETSTILSLASSTPSITKREHALKELLSSERAHASDLAFIRNVHIPMALGKPPPFGLPQSATPPGSSGSSTRTRSTASDSSSGSYHSGAPMTKDDVRIIFGNIAELAVFSQKFSEHLEDALGDVLEDGKGEDCVGSLFLEMIPHMEPLYKQYITRHPVAISHLNALPQTPALTNYLSQTQSLASSVTHAWDLPSLLIKPVQRLLKYPLLLSTIFEQTPKGHGDKENLKNARDRMEDVARNVNEGRRRLEVVKEILTGKSDTGRPATPKKKLNVGRSASLNIGRMKSMSVGLRAARPKDDNNKEAVRVEAYENQLKKCDAFVREFAKDVVGWAHAVGASQEHLRDWAIGFGKSIGITTDQQSEAFNAFLDVINGRLLPLCTTLEETIGREILPFLAMLVDSSKAPMRLLEAMHSLESLHYALLDLNFAKHRPPPAMIEASQKYLALRGQLDTDLPAYLTLLDKGIVSCIRHFATRQTDFWGSVRDQWGALWSCLCMEGETNAGCEETLRLWWDRYREVDDSISKLGMLRRDKTIPFPVRSRSIGPARTHPSSYDTSMDSHSGYFPSPPDYHSSGQSTRHRSIGSLDSAAQRQVLRSPSMECFSSPTSSPYYKSRPRTPDSLGRRKTRSNTSPLPLSSSSPTLNTFEISSLPSSSKGRREYAESAISRNDVRGRQSRSSSFSHMISQSLQAPLRRTPSQKSVGSLGSKYTPSRRVTDDYAAHYPCSADYPLHPPTSPSLYYVTAIHPLSTPPGATYMDYPFFDLNTGDTLGVLAELGHPSQFEDLPLALEEGGNDTLLVVKNEYGDVGLALASFLEVMY